MVVRLQLCYRWTDCCRILRCNDVCSRSTIRAFQKTHGDIVVSSTFGKQLLRAKEFGCLRENSRAATCDDHIRRNAEAGLAVMPEYPSDPPHLVAKTNALAGTVSRSKRFTTGSNSLTNSMPRRTVAAVPPHVLHREDRNIGKVA